MSPFSALPCKMNSRQLLPGQTVLRRAPPAQNVSNALPFTKRWRTWCRSSRACPEFWGAQGTWVAFDELPVWQGNEDEFMKTADSMDLSPATKLLLLSDGSMTRHIGLFMGEKVVVEPLGRPCKVDPSKIPSLCGELLDGPIFQREVLLRTETSSPLIYAVSWWNKDTLDSFFTSWDEPVGSRILSQSMETHRDIAQVSLGESRHLSGVLGEEGPFWGRLFTLWSGGKPICVMYEVMSHHLLMQASTQSNIQRLESTNGKGFNGNGCITSNQL